SERPDMFRATLLKEDVTRIMTSMNTSKLISPASNAQKYIALASWAGCANGQTGPLRPKSGCGCMMNVLIHASPAPKVARRAASEIESISVGGGIDGSLFLGGPA